MFLYYVHMFELLKSLPGEVFVFAMLFSLEFKKKMFFLFQVCLMLKQMKLSYYQ